MAVLLLPLNLFILHDCAYFQSQALDSVGLKDSDCRRFLEFVAAKRLEESRQVKDPYALGTLGFTMFPASTTPPNSKIRPIGSVSSRGRRGSRESLHKLELEPTSPGVHTPIQLRKIAEQERWLRQKQFGADASKSRTRSKRNLPLPPTLNASAPRFDPLAFHQNLLAQHLQTSPQKHQHRRNYGDGSRGNEMLSTGKDYIDFSKEKRLLQKNKDGDDSRGNETLSKGGVSLNSSRMIKSQQHTRTMNGGDSCGNETLSKGNGSLGFSGKLRQQGGAHTSNSVSKSRGQIPHGGDISKSTLNGFRLPSRGATSTPDPLPIRLAGRMKEQEKRKGQQV